MKVSVIMPTYNKYKYLNLTLSGFLNQTYKEFEIILIDDGSSDNTKEIVKVYENLIDIVYYYQSNEGRSSARNKALSLASGELIIFCDDDRIPSIDFIKEHVLAHRIKKNIVTIGYKKEIMSIIQSDKLYDLGKLLRLLKRNPDIIDEFVTGTDYELFESEDIILDLDNIYIKYSCEDSKDNFSELYDIYKDGNMQGFQFGWILGTTANLGVMRSNISSITFDELYVGWGMEDTNFSYELFLNGCEFKLLSSAINYHQFHFRELNYSLTLRKNVSMFCEKYKTLDVYLFAMLLFSNTSIIEINEIYHSISKNINNLIYQSYIESIK